VASHTAELAETNSGYVQRYIRDNVDVLDYGLRNDSKGNWETTNDCRYRAIGVGGAITGTRADIVIIDDPIRGRAEAESAVQRAHLWDWYNSDLLTRLKPKGAIVLIATPYHEDDLMGRLLRLPSAPDDGASWHVLRLPAIADEDDPLGRSDPRERLSRTWLLPWMINGEANAGPRMTDASPGEVFVGQLRDPLPRVPVLLTAAPKRPSP